MFVRVRPLSEEEQAMGQEAIAVPVGDGRNLTLLPPGAMVDEESAQYGRRTTVATTPRTKGTPRGLMSARRHSVVS